MAALLLVLAILLGATIESAVGGCYTYTSLIGFGDSSTDTGNYVLITPPNVLGFPPFGETYFHHPTGRCSDGRIIIDFLAEYLGLPLVPPSEAVVKQNMTAKEFFGSGANFAVVGSPALDSEFYMARGIYNDCTNISLRNQIDQFKSFLSSICKPPSSGCEKQLQSSLVFMGSFGSNDYSQPLRAGKFIDYVLPFVTQVVKAIAVATTQLIEVGVQTIIVPGQFPNGCIPALLDKLETSNKTEYDSNGCHIQLNKLTMYHNEMLQEELQQVQLRYPRAKLIYADYYNTAMQIYNNPRKFGFSAWPLEACCGAGGKYNYNHSLGECGQPTAKVCDNPSLYVNWDGFHFTEAAYRVIFQGLLQGPYSLPPIDSSCDIRGLSTF